MVKRIPDVNELLDKGYEYALSRCKNKRRTRDTRSVVQTDHIPDGAPHGILVPDEPEHADPDSDPVRGIFHLSETKSVAVWDSSIAVFFLRFLQYI